MVPFERFPLGAVTGELSGDIVALQANTGVAAIRSWEGIANIVHLSICLTPLGACFLRTGHNACFLAKTSIATVLGEKTRADWKDFSANLASLDTELLCSCDLPARQAHAAVAAVVV